MTGEVVRVDRRGVTLTGGGRIDAERVLVCAGPDTYRLLGVTEPDRMRSVRFSFALREPLEFPARILDIVVRALPRVQPVAERVIACEFPTRPAGVHGALAHDGWDVRLHNGVLGVTGPSLFKFVPLLGRLVVERLESMEA